MTERSGKFRLPTVDKELLLDPPPHTWAAKVARNRALAEGWDFAVGGLPAVQLREQARRESLELAARRANPGVTGEPAASGHVSRESFKGSASPTATPIVLTGHQPLLVHPGVWVKTFLAEQLAAQLGGLAFNGVVDSDSEEEIAVDLPSVAHRPGNGAARPRVKGLTRRREVLTKIPRGVPFEAAPKPTQAQFEQFCRRALRHLSELPQNAPLRHFERFRRSGLAVLPLADNLPDFLTLARRHYEASYALAERPAEAVVRDVPISALSTGPSFRRFFLDIVWQAECFGATYNDVLADFRRERQVRSPLHPFPDLRVDPDEVELPFWLLARDGQRYPLTVRQPAAGRLAIGVVGDGGEFSAWAEGPAPPPGATPSAAWWDEWEARLRGIEIRPKAVPLTLFSRLFLSDVFIHGVGGGEYDRVTDEVIKRYYGVEPPTYLVASMALYLPLEPLNEGWKFGEWNEGKLRNHLRRMKYNPQAFVGREEDQAAELAQKKGLLIREMWKPSANRRALTREIEETNAALFELLARDPRVSEMQAALSHVRELNRDVETATWRNYPFACYHPESVRAVLRGAVGNRMGEPSRLTESPPHCTI